MRARTFFAVVFLVVTLPFGGAARAADPNAVELGDGLRLWALPGDGMQKGRVGYYIEGLRLEPAVEVLHVDAADDGEDEWAPGGALLIHALTADIAAALFGAETTLPKGDLYAGGFARYWVDRDGEVSGGPLLGGMLDAGDVFGKSLAGVKLVTEYEWTIWNVSDRKYQLFAGAMWQF